MRKPDWRGYSRKWKAIKGKPHSNIRRVFAYKLVVTGPLPSHQTKIVLNDKMKPGRTKVRWYSVEQSNFLNSYMINLWKMVCLIPNAHASWQAAPLLVLKDSHARFRMKIDFRPVNGATKPDAWPMPNIESGMSEFSWSKHFASPDFWAGYCQCPLDPHSYDACGIIESEGSFAARRVLNGLKIASAYLQSAIPTLFHEIQNSMKGWMDNLIIHAKTERELVNILQKCFSTCKKYNLFLFAKSMRPLSELENGVDE